MDIEVCDLFAERVSVDAQKIGAFRLVSAGGVEGDLDQRQFDLAQDALVEAGRVRIRPILLTSITTFLGVSPLIFFASGQTAFLSPMAVSLGFGLLFATGLILVALPCFYLIGDDLRQAGRDWAHKKREAS